MTHRDQSEEDEAMAFAMQRSLSFARKQAMERADLEAHEIVSALESDAGEVSPQRLPDLGRPEEDDADSEGDVEYASRLDTRHEPSTPT